jgi:Na+/melibiose symporter-like transporter
MACSIALGKVGKFQPFMIVGALIAIIGAGLVYTFDLDTGLGKQIGYQLVIGFGVGSVIQLPVIVAGALSAMKDNALALSVVLGKWKSGSTARFIVLIVVQLHNSTLQSSQSPYQTRL